MNKRSFLRNATLTGLGVSLGWDSLAREFESVQFRSTDS